MNVIESTRGSGLVVLDYKTHAGLDFITALTEVPQLKLGSIFLLGYLEIIPMLLTQLVRSSLLTISTQSSLKIIDFQEKQIEMYKANEPPAVIAQFDFQMQNASVRKIDNPVIQAAFNSFAPLRTYLIELYYSTDGDKLKNMEAQKSLWIAFAAQQTSLEEVLAEYFKMVTLEVDTLRTHINSLPENSTLSESPLLHNPELVSLKL